MLRIEDFECGEDSIELDVVFDTDICELLERIAELEAKNAALKDKIAQLKPGWSAGFSAGYDAGYALAEHDYGIHEDTAERLLSPEEIADIGTLPANAPTILEILDEDRGDVEDGQE